MSARLFAAFVVGVAALSACNPPSPTIRMFFSQGDAQSCGTNDCSMIPVTCDFYVGVRIVDPAEPSQPLYTRCQALTPPARNPTACMLNQITLDDLQSLPYRDLQFQIAMFPADTVDTTNPDVPLCPSDTTYDRRWGFAVAAGAEAPPGPAIAGQAYYHPGDSNVDITLGCADTGALSDACSFINSVQARATVDDFDTHVSVGTLGDGRCSTQSPANCISVDIGEPSFLDPDYLLNPAGLTTLTRVVPDPGSPAWSASVNHLFNATACVDVKEEVPQSTTTATCTDEEQPGSPIKPTTKLLNLVGKRLSKASLDQILLAAGLTAPPPDGITIGIVLDRGSPISSQIVTVEGVPSDKTATIRYLNSNRTGFAGTSTSSGANGAVFISTDAPFGTKFRSIKMSTNAAQIGGRIRDKVTIVVLDVGITSTGMN